MRVLAVGNALALVAGIVGFVLYLSPAVAFTAVAFGLLATTIQYGAGKVTARIPKDAAFGVFVRGWGTGMGLRLLGVVVLAVVCSVWPARFPAIGAAIGYLGVLIPLLFLEMRATR